MVIDKIASSLAFSSAASLAFSSASSLAFSSAASLAFSSAASLLIRGAYQYNMTQSLVSKLIFAGGKSDECMSCRDISCQY